MNLRYRKSFQKQFNNLTQSQQRHVKQAVSLFEIEPTSTNLRNHPLKGEWQGYRSISAGGDLRIHFMFVDADNVLFVAVGSHAQLYK